LDEPGKSDPTVFQTKSACFPSSLFDALSKLTLLCSLSPVLQEPSC
jgi:hypothetical protein